MPSRSITFNPDTGVPYSTNLTIYGGSNFNTTFNVTDNANTNFNLTGYSASAAMSKSVSVGATLGITESFTVGITSAIGGKLEISLSSTTTRNLTEGRYVYDVLIRTGSTTHTLVNGNIMVVPVVSAAP
tara:strand:+ start:186 stop:572 length:387 start_codon:yes stop_codon:yes gene_type:complete